MEYEGGLGSRLHKQNNNQYIAYAQWPDKLTWENAGNNLPEKSKSIRQSMREACQLIETLYKLDVVDELLKPYNK